MNIVQHIGNKFVTDIYLPSQIENSVLGFFSLNISGHLSVNLHVKCKPNIEVKKWGEWGKDYNVVVVKLILQGINSIDCKGVCDLSKLRLKTYKIDEGVSSLLFRDETGEQLFNVSYHTSLFQGCSAYIDEAV